MHAMALRDDADIVIGKVVGHGKSVPRNLFRRNRTGVDLEWEALLWLLTPHKLWRRSFLDAHALRFPEGRRRLEDHVFVMRAYFSSPRISVLADYPCYHWVLRDVDSNASWGHLDPELLLREHARGARHRRRAHRAGPVPRPPVRALVPRQDAQPRRERCTPTRTSTAGWRSTWRCTSSPLERFPEQRRRAACRSTWSSARGCCARATTTALAALADFETKLRAHARAVALRRARTAARELERRGGARGAALRARRRRASSGAPAGPTRRPRCATAAPCSCCSSSARPRRSTACPAEVELRLVDEPGGRVRASSAATGRSTPRRAAGGGPLPPGSWEVHAMVIVAGFRAAGRVRRARGRST